MNLVRIGRDYLNLDLLTYAHFWQKDDGPLRAKVYLAGDEEPVPFDGEQAEELRQALDQRAANVPLGAPPF